MLDLFEYFCVFLDWAFIIHVLVIFFVGSFVLLIPKWRGYFVTIIEPLCISLGIISIISLVAYIVSNLWAAQLFGELDFEDPGFVWMGWQVIVFNYAMAIGFFIPRLRKSKAYVMISILVMLYYVSSNLWFAYQVQSHSAVATGIAEDFPIWVAPQD